MKKVVSLFLCMTLLLSMVVWAEPVKICQEAGELIADTEYDEVYYMCSDDLSPIELICAVGMIFDVIKQICTQNSGHWVCKTPKGANYGCHRGHMISFRPTCTTNADCSK